MAQARKLGVILVESPSFLQYLMPLMPLIHPEDTHASPQHSRHLQGLLQQLLHGLEYPLSLYSTPKHVSMHVRARLSSPIIEPSSDFSVLLGIGLQ